MTDEQIYEALTEIFRDILDDDTIVLTSSTHAGDIADWDSFNHINIVVSAEARFGVSFKSAEIEELKNVGEFVELISSRMAA